MNQLVRDVIRTYRDGFQCTYAMVMLLFALLLLFNLAIGKKDAMKCEPPLTPFICGWFGTLIMWETQVTIAAMSGVAIALIGFIAPVERL